MAKVSARLQTLLADSLFSHPLISLSSNNSELGMDDNM